MTTDFDSYWKRRQVVKENVAVHNLLATREEEITNGAIRLLTSCIGWGMIERVSGGRCIRRISSVKSPAMYGIRMGRFTSIQGSLYWTAWLMVQEVGLVLAGSGLRRVDSALEPITKFLARAYCEPHIDDDGYVASQPELWRPADWLGWDVEADVARGDMRGPEWSGVAGSPDYERGREITRLRRDALRREADELDAELVCAYAGPDEKFNSRWHVWGNGYCPVHERRNRIGKCVGH